MTQPGIEGRAALSDLLADNVVYRSLSPVDPRLPGLPALAPELGLDPGRVPRKTEMNYARVVARVVQAAAADRGGGAIESLVYVGDTRHNDGSAWRNLCAVLGCPGVGFIAAERAEPEVLEVVEEAADRRLLLANRWSLVARVDEHLAALGLAVGRATAVVFDMDKTLLGARGRNDRVIDGARMAAVKRTLAEYLGGDFDEGAFARVYDRFNDQRFHPFTTDNQDYLAFICLMIQAGVVAEDELAERVLGGELTDFAGFLTVVDRALETLPDQLVRLHRRIVAAVEAGDPTPFKSFRRNEFLETVERLTPRIADDDLDAVLATEIVITHEALHQGRAWRERGATLLALSDKPDEASIPTRELADRGFVPLHRVTARVVSGST